MQSAVRAVELSAMVKCREVSEASAIDGQIQGRMHAQKVMIMLCCYVMFRHVVFMYACLYVCRSAGR